MDRATIRAALLLRGFHTTLYKYQLTRIAPEEDYGYMRVLIYPRWIIGVHTLTGTKNFLSANKAWDYITKTLDGRCQ